MQNLDYVENPYIDTYMYVSMYLHMYVFLYMCIQTHYIIATITYSHICYVCMYVCKYVCMYV